MQNSVIIALGGNAISPKGEAGSMEPKIQAALYFLQYHGDKVVITSIDGITEAINENNGTIIRN
jgi:carbamate kinase